MSRYGTLRYNTSGQTYGGGRSVTRSTLLAQVTGYGQIKISAGSPNRIGSTYYLIRSYNGAAEHPDAGIKVSTGTVSAAEFIVVDGPSMAIPLTSGWVYYTLLVLDASGSWIKDAATSVLLPSDRGTLDYLIRAIPSVYTSADGNPITPHDPESDLYRFLNGFTLTYDELAASIDSILPDYRGKSTIRRLHSGYATGVGMPDEYTIGVASSARLHREAGYVYRNKGTLLGIEAYVTALTGWQTTVSESPNRFLSLDDSSFESSTGNWGVTGGTIARTLVNGTTVTQATALVYDTSLATFAKQAVGTITLSSASAVATLPSSGDPLLSIPVYVGQAYRWQAPVRASSGTPSVTLAIRWLNQRGVFISEVTSTFTSTTTWGTNFVTGTAPTGAKFAQLRMTVAGTSGNAIRLDQMGFVDTLDYVGGAYLYRDPRSVDVVCYPARVNLVKDPSFEGGLANWASTSGTLTVVTTTAYRGVGSAKIVGTGHSFASTSMPVLAGYAYTANGSAQSSGGSSTIGIAWYTGAGALISTSSTAFGTLAASSWKSATVSATAPATAVTAKVVFTGSGTVYVDAVSMEQNDRASVFFSGTVGDSSGTDSSWAGTAAASYSLLYPGRLSKLVRLRDTLPYYLPINVTSRILLWDSADPEVQALLPYGA